MAFATTPMFGNGTTGTASFSYDALDNLTKLVMPATATSAARTQYYCYDSTTRRLASLRSAANCGGTVQTSLTYDARGNIATKGGMTFDFDLTNRLKSIDNGGVVENYRYDGYGLRALKNASSGNLWSQYTRDGRLLQEVNARTGIQTEYVYLGGSLVAERETPTAGGTAVVKYQHTDALGTPVAVTSASRAVLTRNEYEPYGQLLNHTITDAVGYTGHVQDAMTGLTYMQQRYYDPMLGRFLSVDPVTATSVGGNFNRYWYGNDNPYKFKDPDGRLGCASSHIEAKCASDGFASTSFRSPIDTGRMVPNRSTTSGSSRSSSAPSAGAQNKNSTTRLNQYGLEPGDATTIAGGTLTAEDMAAQFLKWLPKSMGVADLPDGKAMLKAGGRLGAAVSGVNIALSANEAFNGESSADRWHGRINLALAAAPAIVGPEVIVVTRPYGWLDSAVQFREYVDPLTGERSTGWSALYNQFVR
jgi:RHS repeat-associated protein